MAWNEQWTHGVDGTALNDFANFITFVPELDDGFSGEIRLVPIAGDVPWFHRVQPQAGKFTFLVQMANAGLWSVYSSRLATLKALFAAGAHTYVVQARGNAAAKTYSIICDGGWMIDAKTRRFTAVATVLVQV